MSMIKEIKRKSFVFLSVSAAIMCLSVSLVSCGGKYDEEEIISAARELIEESYEINDIYFGDGLELSDEEAAREEQASGENMNYYAVDEECGYSSTNDIKEATLKVYTEKYSNVLFESAFSGFSVEIGEEDAAREYAVSYARYIDSAAGFLSERLVSEEEKLELSRTYDLDKIEVKKQRKNYTLISVPSFSGGEESDVIELRLEMTDNGWRLDTPTY